MFGYAKKIEEIIRESAFDRKKKKPGLKFNPGLALTGVRTTGPWYVTKPKLQSHHHVLHLSLPASSTRHNLLLLLLHHYFQNH